MNWQDYWTEHGPDIRAMLRQIFESGGAVMTTSSVIPHGVGGQLTPDAVDIYHVPAGDATFNLPPLASITEWQTMTLKLFDFAGNNAARVRLKRHDDDGGDILWDGTSGGDYVHLIKHRNGNVYVFDHFETIIIRLNKNGHQNVSGRQQVQVTSWHVIEDTLGLWSNNELNVPYLSRMDLSWHMVPGDVHAQSGMAAEVVVSNNVDPHLTLEPNFSELEGGSAHGASYTPITFIGNPYVWPGNTIKLFARNLDNTSNHVDARSNANIRLRWRLK